MVKIEPRYLLLFLGLCLATSNVVRYHTGNPKHANPTGLWFHKSCVYWGICEKCPMRRRGEAIRYLSHNVFGQTEALLFINNALNAKSRTRPLSMHFVGDNGVGKTLAATVIARGLFSRVDAKGQPVGLLYMQGSHYTETEPQHIIPLRDEIRGRVLSHLLDCPRGVVVLDEVELLNVKTISVFQEFLDYTHPTREYNGEKVEINKAIYIFISDFSAADVTRNKGHAEIEKMVKKEASLIWAGEPKQHQLIDLIIPFYPKSLNGCRSLVRSMISNVIRADEVIRTNDIDVMEPDEAELSALGSIIFHLSESGPNSDSNYRGVERTVRQAILNPIVESIETEGRVGQRVWIKARNKQIVFTWAPILREL